MAKRKIPIDKSKWTLEQLCASYKNPYSNDQPMHQMIRNTIKTSCRKYDGKDYTTTLDSIYFLMHGHQKEDVNNELAKWVDLTGVDPKTPIILPEKFFL